MKGCAMREKDENTDDKGCRKFVEIYICDCENVLRKLQDDIRTRGDIGGRTLLELSSILRQHEVSNQRRLSTN